MVTAVAALGLAVLVLGNSAAAALLTRFFRVRLKTQWGSVFYISTVIPIGLLLSTLVFGSVLGPDLGTVGAVVGITILLPFSLGVTFDYVWMPTPDEVDLPESTGDGNVRRDT